jgi:hypothetical protein
MQHNEGPGLGKELGAAGYEGDLEGNRAAWEDRNQNQCGQVQWWRGAS